MQCEYYGILNKLQKNESVPLYQLRRCTNHHLYNSNHVRRGFWLILKLSENLPRRGTLLETFLQILYLVLLLLLARHTIYTACIKKCLREELWPMIFWRTATPSSSRYALRGNDAVLVAYSVSRVHYTKLKFSLK